MPIRFRCSYCNRLLGIATRKAGMETTCPHCGYTITVPLPPEAASEPVARVQEGDARTERINLDDVEEMLGHTVAEREPAGVAVAPAAASTEDPQTVAQKPAPPRHEPPPMAAPILVPPHPKGQKTSPAPKPPKAPRPPLSNNPDERPLFEGDVDEILGVTAEPEEPEREKKPAVSGMDAMSIGEPARNIIISPQKATLLMVFIVVLLVVAFASGYFLAPKS